MKKKNFYSKERRISTMKLEENLKVHAVDKINLSIVYFLLDDDETVVYVGQSVNGLTRVMDHYSNPAKHFTKYAYIEIPDKQMLDLIESYYIAKYNPKHNVAAGLYNVLVNTQGFEENTPGFIERDNYKCIFALQPEEVLEAETYLQSLKEAN